MLNKIAKLDYASEYSMAHLWGKVNIVIQALNNLKCVEEEEPIYEVLTPGDCLIISKNTEGLLVACAMDGKIELKRIKYPEEVQQQC